MRRPSPAIPSPLARREALRRQLAAALVERDAGAVQRLSTQWVHRHGVTALEPLMRELVAASIGPGDGSEPPLLQWWRLVLRQPVAARAAEEPSAPVQTGPAATAPGPVPEAGHGSGARVVPFPRAAVRGRPAPVPAHPGLASLRAWLSTPADGADLPSLPEELDRAA